MKWEDGYVVTDPPKRPKKITGTHFPSVIRKNPYSTPFEVWCRCTRTYEKPFEGNEYTNAGKVIEPKVFDFLRTSMGYGDSLVTPEDVYGKDFFKKTHGDFYPDKEIFGGMWDALIMDGENIESVVEIKTVCIDGYSGDFEERWMDGKAPDYQGLQASLYAWLLGIDHVMMVAVTLEKGKGDYEHPEKVEPSFANNNVYIDEFDIYSRYPQFDLYVESARGFWETHVLKGVSPLWSDKDSKLIAEMKTKYIDTSKGSTLILAEWEKAKMEYDEAMADVEPKKKRLDDLTKQLKAHLTDMMGEMDKVYANGNIYEITLSKSVRTVIDKAKMEEDGILDAYSILEDNYRLTTKLRGEK